MAKLMLVGKTNVGKTSLVQALYEEKICYRKTQAAEYYNSIVDIPGEYLENPRFYNAIVTMSFDVDIIALVQDVESDISYFPPHFGDMFNVRVIGIITKVDIECSLEHLARAREFLIQAGAKEIFEVSAITGDGVDDIKKMICNL